jgi:hypothetical protein
MAAHRYWRFTFSNPSSVNFGVGEVELRTSVGGSDQTGSGTASASSIYSGSYPASLAFANDGSADANSWVSAASTSAWLMYDFGAGNAKDIVEFQITSPTTQAYMNRSPNFGLQYSDDNTNWTDIGYYSATWTSNESKVFNVGICNTSSSFNLFNNAFPTVDFTVLNYSLCSTKVLYFDVQDGGSYKIYGVASRAGVPTQRKIALFDRFGRRLIKEIASNEDGTYSFNNIAYRVDGYFVVEFDDPALAQPYNASISDFVTPVPM